MTSYLHVYLLSEEGHEEEMTLGSWEEFATVKEFMADIGANQDEIVVPCPGHGKQAIMDVVSLPTRLTRARTAAVWDLLRWLQPSKSVLQHWVNQLDRSTYTNVLSKHALEWLWDLDAKWSLAENWREDANARDIRWMIEQLSDEVVLSKMYLEWVVVSRYTNAGVSAVNYSKLLRMEDTSCCDWLTRDGYVCTARTTPQGLYTHHMEALAVLLSMDTRYLKDNVITSSAKKLGKSAALEMMKNYLGTPDPYCIVLKTGIRHHVYLSSLLPFWMDLLEMTDTQERLSLMGCSLRACTYGAKDDVKVVSMMLSVARTYCENWYPKTSEHYSSQKEQGDTLMVRLCTCLEEDFEVLKSIQHYRETEPIKLE